MAKQPIRRKAAATAAPKSAPRPVKAAPKAAAKRSGYNDPPKSGGAVGRLMGALSFLSPTK